MWPKVNCNEGPSTCQLLCSKLHPVPFVPARGAGTITSTAATFSHCFFCSNLDRYWSIHRSLNYAFPSLPFCHHKSHCDFISWQLRELFLDEKCHLPPPTQALSTPHRFPKLAHHAVTQALLLTHAAKWRWSGPWEVPQKTSAKRFSVLWDCIVKNTLLHLQGTKARTSPLGLSLLPCTKLPSKANSLFPVPRLYTALENSFFSAKSRVEVNSFRLTAWRAEKLKHV